MEAYKAGLKFDGPPQAFKTSSTFYGLVSNSAIAKYGGMSLSSANRLKLAAKREGFIKIRKNAERVASYDQFAGDKSFKHLDQAHRIRRQGDYLVLDLPDFIASLVKFKKRKNLGT